MIPVALVVLALVLVAVVIVIVRLSRRRKPGTEEGGADLIPYLIMALAVGIAGFALADLARTALSPARIVGRPTSEIAGSLAALVVSAPTAFLLWRRQARRRRSFPDAAGWPLYLALVELTFLTAFFVAVSRFAGALTRDVRFDWPDLVVYGGIVALNWWAERHGPPRGDSADLPALTGSAVALVALTIGWIGTLDWVFSQVFDLIWGLFRSPDAVEPVALALVGTAIWAWRWRPLGSTEPSGFRNIYLGVVTPLTLIAAIGAVVTLVVTLLTYFVDSAERAQDHFSMYPETLAFALVFAALWLHHKGRLAPGRGPDRRGYQYAMTAAGLTGLVVSVTALIVSVLEPPLAGTAELVIGVGCTAIASGWVWFRFWREVQSAPRAEELTALPRRFYLIGMAILMGLTSGIALIATLVVVFQFLLGESGELLGDVRVPLVVAITSGLAGWHLFTHIRADAEDLREGRQAPYTVTVICSHPGPLATSFPREATTRVIYRGDDEGVIDEEMAAAIVAAVGHRSSIVWVDGGGFRVAPARQS